MGCESNQENGTCHLVLASLVFVVSWAVPTWADHKGTLLATEVTGKEAPIGSPGTGILFRQPSAAIKDEN